MSFKKGCIPWNKGKRGLQQAWNKGMRNKNHFCLVCGKPKDYKSKYWCRDCFNKYFVRNTNGLKKHQSGKDNPMWKGGVTPENKKARNSEVWKQWRKVIFARDNYECQICGKNTHNLLPHHIKKFSDHKEIRFSENNGVTLCSECHINLVNMREKDWESYFNFNLETRRLIFQ